MTTFAQLEGLLGSLPSNVVGHIHDYAKHPVAELYKVSGMQRSHFLRFASVLIIAYLLATGAMSIVSQLQVLRQQGAFWSQLAERNPDVDLLARTADSNEAIVDAANANVLRGGPVNPYFRRTYGLTVP